MTTRMALNFGGANANLGALSRLLQYPHDIIRVSSKITKLNLPEFRRLYTQGLSLREIGQRTGFTKNTVQRALKADGVVIRDFKNCCNQKHDLTKVRRSGNTPFGYTYLEGQLVVDPQEYKLVLDIYRQWQSGKSFRAIARNLNGRGEATRFGKSWKHEVIKNIVKNHEDKLNKEKRR